MGIHKEDQKAVEAVGEQLQKIEELITEIVCKLREGGRLLYIGAGTSGRLGVLDASECPPTFGTDPEMVIGLIAGGSKALQRSIEDAEDDPNQGWIDLLQHQVNEKDFVIGIAASGTTPYVLGAINICQENCIPSNTCSRHTRCCVRDDECKIEEICNELTNPTKFMRHEYSFWIIFRE